MSIVPIMWAIWAALVIITGAIYIYRGRLTRDEDDQIFLDDSFSHEKVEQAAITAKVEKVQPLLRISVGLATAATVFVIGYYIWDIANRI